MAAKFVNPATEINYGNQYHKESKKAKVFKIVESAQIRSEPIVYDDSADGDSNSFGKVEEAGFTVEITKFYEATVIDKANGAFYGFSVKEIRKTPEGRDYFPKKIKEDPDGIVWINAKYVDVY